MIAWPPFVGFVCRMGRDKGGNVSRREDEVQLTSRGARRLPVCMIRRHVQACARQLVRPRVGLATVRELWSDEGKTDLGKSIEDALIPRCPIAIPVFAMTVEDVQVSRRKHPMTPFVANKDRYVGDQAMCGCVGIDPGTFG